MKNMMFAVLFFVFTSTIKAQTANTLAWDYPEVLATVQTYTQSVTVNGTVQSGTPTCVAAPGNTTTCSLNVNNLSNTGTNTVAISASKSGITATTTINGLNVNNAPKNAVNVRIQINVVVNLP